MKAILGVLSLLIVLAVVAAIASSQLGGVAAASRQAGAASEAAALGEPGRRDAGAIVTDPAAVQQLSRDMQQRARDDTTRALQQGAERNQQAER